jgi:hypothetical protein
MVALRIIVDGEGALPELAPAVAAGRLVRAPLATLAALPGGMQSGEPSVAAVIDLPDGRVVFAETSLRMLLAACDAFVARHGDPRT